MARVASALAAISIAGTAFAAPATEVAPSPAPGGIGVAYSIAFWGIPFGATSYEGKFSGGEYTASSHFETSGIVSLFWQAAIDATAAGRMGPAGPQPAEYDSYYRRSNSKKERVKVTFETGSIITFADPPYDMTKYPVSEAEKREAVDPMSAITLALMGFRADRANPCGSVVPVFDGRRRYDIEFTYLKDEPVTLAGGIFSGTAHLCQLHYRQIAGFKPKILKEGAAFPPIFGDFGDVPAAGAPNGHYVVPLKLWSHLDWGTVSAQLTRLRPQAPAPR